MREKKKASEVRGCRAKGYTRRDERRREGV